MAIYEPTPMVRSRVSANHTRRLDSQEDWTSSFQRPDPFFGKRHDPQSLNKYVYGHGDPVNNIDPTGLFSLAGSIVVSGISGTLRGLSQSAIVGAAIGGLFKLAWYYGIYRAVLKLQEQQQPLVPLDKQKVRADYDYALLAEAAYESSTLNVPGWQEIHPFAEPSIGFHARLFERNADGERVLAYAGTMEPVLADWGTNIQQGILGDSAHYRKAIETVVEAETAFGPIDRFVGHSLGGGLASTAALIYNKPATTFNASGVNPGFLTLYGANLGQANQLIDSYRVQGEVLSSVQNVAREWGVFPHPVTAALGMIGSIAPNGVGTTYWLPGTSFDPIWRHFNADVQEGMRQMM